MFFKYMYLDKIHGIIHISALKIIINDYHSILDHTIMRENRSCEFHSRSSALYYILLKNINKKDEL
jgi:hypothetical protein